MKHWRHDGRHPGGLAVGSMELILQVSVEDSHTGGERQGQRHDHHGSNEHHPAPSTIWSCDSNRRWDPAFAYVANILEFTAVDLWHSLPLHTAGSVTSHGGCRVEAVVTCPSEAILLSHFLLSAPALLSVLHGLWFLMKAMSLCNTKQTSASRQQLRWHLHTIFTWFLTEITNAWVMSYCCITAI